MATIEELLEENFGGDIVDCFRRDSESVRAIFKPFYNAKFKDFEWIGFGTSSFLVAPTDNPNIVFRVSEERDRRNQNIPFFLHGCYEKYYDLGDNYHVHLEILLRGEKNIPEHAKTFLFDEMKFVGWNPDNIENKDSFWKDVVMVSVRDEAGRTKTVPIISDPSALLSHLNSVRPTGTADRPLPNYNSSSSNYITLQDQARAYNAVIAQDERLQKLIPEPVVFPETEVISMEQKRQAAK